MLNNNGLICQATVREVQFDILIENRCTAGSVVSVPLGTVKGKEERT
jgi:hypothetical protein